MQRTRGVPHIIPQLIPIFRLGCILVTCNDTPFPHIGVLGQQDVPWGKKKFWVHIEVPFRQKISPYTIPFSRDTVKKKLFYGKIRVKMDNIYNFVKLEFYVIQGNRRNLPYSNTKKNDFFLIQTENPHCSFE